jgi:DinB superfamily
MSADRAATILARFNSAHNDLMWQLRDCAFDAAEQFPGDEGWSAAQIGCHVAMVNDYMAAVLLGEKDLAQPVAADFTESFDHRALPPKLKTSTSLEPPEVIGIDSALARLRASGHHMSKAIASLTEERGSRYCVKMPFGTLSLFELAEFTAAHVSRHVGQVQRTVGKT